MTLVLPNHMHKHLNETIWSFILAQCNPGKDTKTTYKKYIDLLVTICASHLWEEGECSISIKKSIKEGTQPGFGFLSTSKSKDEDHVHVHWIIIQLIQKVTDNAIETGITNNEGQLVYLDRQGHHCALWLINPFI